MSVLISNDDGLYSEGLDILIKFAKTLSDDVYVVVPNAQRSAGGHGITVHNILHVKEMRNRVWTTSGTPADCVLLAIHDILKDKKVDLVLSGVNQGENIGDDIAYSGTIAVAREAAMHGIKSIAFSQSYIGNYGIDYSTAEDHIKSAYNAVKDLSYDDVFYNINFPSLGKGSKLNCIKFVQQGKRMRKDVIEKRINCRNEEYSWLNVFIDHSIKNEEIITDIDAIANNCISITPISVNFTDFNVLNSILKKNKL